MRPLESRSGALYLVPDSLTQNAGVITAVIGNRIYTGAVTGSANVRQQIYLVPGQTTLVLSTNPNSIGPAGYSNWILIGAFYPGDVDDSWGAEVNIVGLPRTIREDTDEFGKSFGIAYSGLIQDQNGTDVQSGSPVINFRRYHVHGELGLFSGGYYHTTTPGTGGVGVYGIRIPQNMLIRMEQVTGSNTGIAGFGGAGGGDLGGGRHSSATARNGRNGNEFHLQIVDDDDSGAWGGNAENNYSMAGLFVGVAWSRMAFRLEGETNEQLIDR